MSEVKVYATDGKMIPLSLAVIVDDTLVSYRELEGNGYVFYIHGVSEERAMELVEAIIARIKLEHDRPEHGISWRTASLKIVPSRYDLDVAIEWKYYIHDSY